MEESYDPLTASVEAFTAPLRAPLSKDRIEHNVPLIETARLERHFRSLFLYHEEAAKQVHHALLRYATAHPYILTAHAEKVITTLATLRNSGVYAVELVVPKAKEGMGLHVALIDMVSFIEKGINETVNFLTDGLITPLKLVHFKKPEHRGDIRHGYFSVDSSTKVDYPGKVEITCLKVRQLTKSLDLL
jgi:hypothetical protein